MTPEQVVPDRPFPNTPCGPPQFLRRFLDEFSRMANSPAPTIAYYTVVNDDRSGWTGGLLLLNQGGRPLEFHCTLPVRPTRAHEILYGQTLCQHLVGDVIGPLLIEKCRTPISLLCVDRLESLGLSGSPAFPVALVREGAELTSHPASTPMKTVLLAGARLLVSELQAERVRDITRQFNDLPDAVEPFERIREAIKEAQSQIARGPAVRPQAAA